MTSDYIGKEESLPAPNPIGVDIKDAPQIVDHIHKPLALTVYDTKWVPSSARFALVGCHARGTGVIQIHQLNHGELELVAETEKHAAFKCCTFAHSTLEERQLATGDFEGRLNCWDLERLDTPTYNVKAHKQIVNAIDGCGGLLGYGAPEIATGSRDGCVRVWDVRQKDKPVASYEPEDGEARDCWSVAFGNSYNADERCLLAGYDNGDIKMFDLRTNKIKWEQNIKNGVCSLEFDRKNIEMNKFVATTLENRFRVYDLRTLNKTEGFACCVAKSKVQGTTIWVGKHLPQNRDLFMIGGGDGSLNLYKYNYPDQRRITTFEGETKGVPGEVELLNRKPISSQPICCFDWHPNKEGLCVYGSFDQSIRVAIVTKLHKF